LLSNADSVSTCDNETDICKSGSDNGDNKDDDEVRDLEEEVISDVFDAEDTSSVQIKRHPSIRKKKNDPKLHISQDMNSLLNRVGASVSEEIDQEDIDKAKEEIAERRASPLRFPNSVSRRRAGVSPVRIPTIFAKADKEASKYREMAKVAIRMSPGVKKPFLPLSTNLVNAPSVLEVKSRLDTSNRHDSSTAGHTPSRLFTDNSLQEAAENDTSKTKFPEPSTPQIKAGLLPSRILGSTSKTPAKSLKRLQGTTTGLSRSPKKVFARPAEPTAVSMNEWSL
jgi:hypothetical protein